MAQDALERRQVSEPASSRRRSSAVLEPVSPAWARSMAWSASASAERTLSAVRSPRTSKPARVPGLTGVPHRQPGQLGRAGRQGHPQHVGHLLAVRQAHQVVAEGRHVDQ